MIAVRNLMIDLLDDNDDIIKIQKEKKVTYEFVNILEYIKEKYEVYIVDLAKILGTTRPTIYSYFSKKTSDLSSKLKNKIAYVYNVRSFEEVIELEKRVELAHYYDKPFLEDFVLSEGGIMPQDVKHFRNEFEKIYTIKRIDNQYAYVDIKKQYDFKLIWKQALQEHHADELGMQTFRLQGFETPGLNKLMVDLIETTSLEYMETLLRIVKKKLEDEDLRFINYIDDYDDK